MTTTISVTANSTEISNGSEDAPPPVSVTINGQVVPGKHMLNSTTFRLIIFSPNAPPTDPSSFLYNQQVCDLTTDGQSRWSGTYRSIYDYAHNLLFSYGDPNNLFFLFATNGFDKGMVPPPSFCQLLFSCGAGTQLQTWVQQVPGQVNTASWVTAPANYIFIGASGLGFNQPLLEKYEVATASGLLSTTGQCSF